MDIVTIEIYWTVAVAILLVGIFIYAYSGSRKKQFDECAQIPLEDDDELDARLATKGHDNG
jgi:cbb3-type cytochrome oxidase subunit 3